MRLYPLALLLIATATPVLAQSELKTAPTPAADGSRPRERLVTVFGTDPCPKAASADEIIVCSRRPDEERYRIPPTVRAGAGVRPGITGKGRAALVGNAAGGAGGSIGSCSAVGPGGGSGCSQQMQDSYREENESIIRRKIQPR